MYRRWLIAIVLLCVSPRVILGGDPGKGAGPESSRLVGKLVLNAGKDNHAPPYCVLDHGGKVVGEVSPAAGVDLKAYCDRTVTLVGTMVATPKDAPPHLVATRVVGADLPFNLPVTGQAALQDGQPPVHPTAYQEPSLEILPPGNPQPKREQMPNAGQRSLLSSPVQESEQAPPAVPMPPPVPVPPPVPMPGPFPVTAQAAESVDSGEPACGACEFSCPRRGNVWGEVDYLVWWTAGMSVPALVTEGNAVNDPGALGINGTTILFGGDKILDGGRSGGRVEIGYWVDDCHTSGIEVEYLGLEDGADPYRIWSSGNPVIVRPYFDAALPGFPPAGELVAYPVGGNPAFGDPIAGSVRVDARTDFQAAAARWRWEWFGEGSFCNPGDCSLCQWGHRVDVTLGYRYLQLNDSVGIREELTATTYYDEDANTHDSFRIQDSFQTHNQFHGGELGLDFQTRQGRWTMELAPRLALGTAVEDVTIGGSTTITNYVNNTTVSSSYPVGILALKSNIGTHQQDVFAVVPEIAFKLGFQLTPRLRFTTGYDFLYWSRVARAGSEINLHVDPNGFAPPSPTATNHPGFAFQESGFWAQGLSVGLDYGW